MQKRTALITGAYGAIGKAIVRQIAEKGYKVVMIGRDEGRLKNYQSELEKKGHEVDYEVADLSRKQSIRDLAERWEGGIELLINDAATTPRKREETPEGIEAQWATSVLGYFWMIKYMHPYMEGREDARIVNVASYWAGGLDLEDPEFEHRSYDNDTAYRQSKQANRMLSKMFADELKDKDIAVNAVHPGDVNSKLSNNLGYGGFESPDQGADSPVWVATAEELKGVTGKYFEHRNESNCQFCGDEEEMQKLWKLCEGY